MVKYVSRVSRARKRDKQAGIAEKNDSLGHITQDLGVGIICVSRIEITGF